jgi:hypothetical protein
MSKIQKVKEVTRKGVRIRKTVTITKKRISKKKK